MRRLAALASLLLTGATSAPLQVFVEQGVAPGARTEVLMLRADGAYKGITSIAKRSRRDRGQLNTERGYWYHCGSWRALPDGKVVVHRQLVESFSYFALPSLYGWSTTVFTPVPGAGARRLIAGGKTYAQVAHAPLSAGWASGESQACDASRKREPPAG